MDSMVNMESTGFDSTENTDSTEIDSTENTDESEIDCTEVLMDNFMDSADVPDEEVPVDVEGRLSSLIERVKKEYCFNMPDFFHMSECFEKLYPHRKSRAWLLYESLCNAKVQGGALKEIDMSFYGERQHRNVFLRSCYFDMFELILDSLKIPSGNYWHLILGSPGIGKSWFHVFCLYVLIKANVPVFIQREENSALYYNGELYRCKDLIGNSLFTKSNIWRLYDRSEAPTGIWPENISVMVSSPNSKTYDNYAKLCRFGVMYMPLWNYTELKLSNLLRTPPKSILSERRLKERFELCGGIARHIFDDFRVYSQECERVISGFYNREPHPCLLKDVDKVRSTIFGLSVPNNYFEFEIRFLSDSIKGEVKQILRDEVVDSLMNVII